MSRDAIEFLHDNGIRLPSYHYGEHYVTCPQCSNFRKKKHAKCLAVKLDETGCVWFCQHCNWKSGGKADTKRIEMASVNHRGMGADQKLFLARGIWNQALPIKETVAERYLNNRGIFKISPSLRFAPELLHTPTGFKYPALVAAVQDARGQVTAIQRIYLTSSGRKAQVEPNKMTLGPLGGGAVRFSRPDGFLVLAEGLETAMSVWQLFSYPCWACLGKRLDRVEPPAGTRVVHLFGDNDAPGREAVAKAAAHCEGLGFEVGVKFPPQGFKDFNDALQGGWDGHD